MRSAGNFSPEWGYLAPAPSFMRTARIVLVATAVGATAGAGVVLSLSDRPAAEGANTSLAAHAIVTSEQAATAPTAPVASAPVTASTQVPLSVVPPLQAKAPAQTPAQAKIPVPAKPTIGGRSTAITAPQIPAGNSPAASAGASDANTVSAPQASPGIAALSEAPAAGDATPSDLPDGTTVTPEMSPPKKAATQHHSASGESGPGLGTMLRRMFSAHAGTSYYPSR